ncbi:MAG: protein-L-isoaspartate(D-aspartate) O-methyltransferase [Candidatus Krumholzibacteriota bacterium]|nr:protein-L-isoaspartate(D-aspartate) O-methyltransferase [Candidatus Krumholzibacteriota bacterium]
MDFAKERERMVQRQLVPRGIRDERVLAAMGAVPRHRFVPAGQQRFAYDDCPLPIGPEQTISQPYIVALMSECARLDSGDRALEIGTGSGYQAAVLAAMGVEVWSVEIAAELSRQAAANLREAGCAGGVHLRVGDGWTGWPEAAPFQAVLVTAAPLDVPHPLLEQLADGGRLVAPVGLSVQDLVLVRREGDDYHRESLIPVRFVPMRGRAESPSPDD